MVISDAKSAGHVCTWIAGCVVLYNFLIVKRFAEDVGLDPFEIVQPEDDPLEQAKRAADMASVPGQRRAQLFAQCFVENNYSTAMFNYNLRFFMYNRVQFFIWPEMYAKQ